jgi:hypothetical protein
MNEKRKEHRLRANLAIKLTWGKEKELLARTENISRLGTYVVLSKEIPAGQAVGITLELPAYTQDPSFIGDVTCTGTVFRASPVRQIEGEQWYGMGIFFTDFEGPADKQKVSAFVDHLIAREEQDVKEGLKRRKEKGAAYLDARHKKDIDAGQDEFQKETLGLLQQISSRLDAIERQLKPPKK